MQKGHFWPLEAGKRKKNGFLGPRNKVFHVFWPPEAKKDLFILNTKKFDFEKNFFVFYVKRSYLAFGGQKTAKDRVFGIALHVVVYFTAPCCKLMQENGRKKSTSLLRTKEKWCVYMYTPQRPAKVKRT